MTFVTGAERGKSTFFRGVWTTTWLLWGSSERSTPSSKA